TTTAEGIETEQQREIAKASGCNEMQGYLFSRPIAVQDLRQLLFRKAARVEASMEGSTLANHCLAGLG
ncbi:EAL domain-containing protein, partial [Bradyrhizobium sp.]|uniref:EAL domain-containing protein n=1 Tax=Bradyrhizobium sp. TaxID=376 RepID=UPI0040383573